MLDYLLVPVIVLYFLVVGLLFAYGLNFFYLTFLTLKHSTFKPEPPPMERWPSVTVQLPIYNEMYVAERLIDAAAALDYPPDLLEIQVLDDSTDETVELVGRTVSRLQARGVRIHHLHRQDRRGFKAGALADGLKSASGELVAIFDADFIPPSDFLKRAVPHLQNPRIAFVQTCWGHVNRSYSLLSFLQSLAIDAHFNVEQFGRFIGNFWFNFNGTAGVWRRAAIEDAGGWQADTLTEDLDLSYRAHLRGWQAVYLRDVVVPAELPVSFNAYRRQQQRWSRGSFECAAKLIPQIWKAPISRAMKVQASLHLTGYAVHLLMFALTFLYPIMLILSPRYEGLMGFFGLAAVLNLTTFAPTVLFFVAQRQLGRSGWRQLPAILFLSVLGSGMMVNTLRAASYAFARRREAFERTPKYGIERKQQDWMRRRYQLRLDPIVFAELAFAVWNAETAWLSIRLSNWIIAFYAALFCVGLLFVAGLSVVQTFAVLRTRQEIAKVEG